MGYVVPMEMTEAPNPGVVITKDGITVEIAGREWRLGITPDLEELWNTMGASDFEDERLPYWTELWPSSVGLAQFLHEHAEEIAARDCLDLGCGLGLTALVAQHAGANVFAVDYEFQALLHCRANSMLNGIKSPMWCLMDWRRPAVRPSAFWRIWGGDILYEERSMRPVLSFFDLALSEGGKAWIAEPGRTIFRKFLDLLSENAWNAFPVASTSLRAVRPQDSRVRITIWELSKSSSDGG